MAYTEQDKARKHEWECIFESLQDVLDRYMQHLASDSSASKGTFESALVQLAETAKAQAKLWSNPNTAETAKLESEHNIYSL